jgi:peptidyl-prolyl cis-trans isomerase B (cyclophilin B)
MLVNPPVSVQAYVDTNIGSIQVELAMLDAPLAVESFVMLARAGHFDGLTIVRVFPNREVQAGDIRGDGTGGPGYTLRDEIAQRPVLRGTVGLVQAGRDSGGSQFFIALSPLPERDAGSTVIGRVVGGMDVADQIQQGDTVRHIRIWDGQTMQ